MPQTLSMVQKFKNLSLVLPIIVQLLLILYRCMVMVTNWKPKYCTYTSAKESEQSKLHGLDLTPYFSKSGVFHKNQSSREALDTYLTGERMHSLCFVPAISARTSVRDWAWRWSGAGSLAFQTELHSLQTPQADVPLDFTRTDSAWWVPSYSQTQHNNSGMMNCIAAHI